MPRLLAAFFLCLMAAAIVLSPGVAMAFGYASAVAFLAGAILILITWLDDNLPKGEQ